MGRDLVLLDAPVRSLESVIDVPKDLRGPLVNSRGRGSPRGRGRGARVQQQRPMQQVQLVEEENPEGWSPEDEKANKSTNEGHSTDALARISLDEEVDANILQHQQHRTSQYALLNAVSFVTRPISLLAPVECGSLSCET